MNKNKNPLISVVPAARELRKVPGFDPLKYLRTVTRDGEKVLKLDLRYKRLWFRLACPNGRMLLNPLRITDQMAIIEARIYASKDDTTPLANFTSTQMARNVPGGLYIRAAQDEALNEALDNAGFGIQLCDVAQVSDGSGLGSEIPLSQMGGAVREVVSSDDPVVEPPAETPTANAVSVEAPVEDAAPAENAESDTPAPSAPAVQESAAAVEDTVQHQEMSDQPAAEPAEPANAAEEIAPPLQEDAPAANPPHSNVTPLPDAGPVEPSVLPETEGEAEAAQPDGETAAQDSYTEDMTVEEICARMTLEEARDILVPLGTCKGWTLGQVADRRAASLKWYVVGCSGATNVLKAGATLLLNALQMKKAG